MTSSRATVLLLARAFFFLGWSALAGAFAVVLFPDNHGHCQHRRNIVCRNMLKTRYFNRLGFPRESVDLVSVPSKENLDKIVETHLNHVTFDNLSQHGLPFTASLDTERTARKILDERRGGFCFEVNGLLGELLLELDYPVKRVPAIVHAGPKIGFRGMPTHLVLIVRASGHDWFVDVGFGEPAIHPLKYELDIEQETPEGMVSRVIRYTDDSNREKNVAILEWRKDGAWAPRLKWEFDHPGQELAQFEAGLNATLDESSIFHQKLIVCKINREEKVTLAGTRLKRTSPRFGPESETKVEELESEEEVKKVLKDLFGVPDAAPLDITRSVKAEPEIWTTL